MKFNELAGDGEVDTRHAIAHLTSWFEPTDQVVVVGMRSVRIAGQNVMSQVIPVGELVEQLRGPDGPEMLAGLSRSPDGTHWDIYISVAAVSGMESVMRRGGIDRVSAVPGVYVDLDVKPGSFQSRAEILEYLQKLPEPTLVASSGSEGVHAYWRYTAPLGEIEAGALQRAWWAMLVEKAAPREIDHLVDTSRVMRLAGSIRWPKPKEQTTPRLATVLHRNPSARYSPQTLRDLAGEASRRRDEKIRETRARDAQHRLEVSDLAELALSGGDNEWAALAALATVEDTFNTMLTWDEILCPRGWTYLREDREGRREFARPGSYSKSASVDWPESPHIMSLHSWSPDTGLADLKEANIPLSKFRVAQRLIWNDDYDAMVKWVLGR